MAVEGFPYRRRRLIADLPLLKGGAPLGAEGLYPIAFGGKYFQSSIFNPYSLFTITYPLIFPSSTNTTSGGLLTLRGISELPKPREMIFVIPPSEWAPSVYLGKTN